MSVLGIPPKCYPIRPIGAKEDIGDLMRELYAANLLNGNDSLSSSKRCAKTLGLDIPDWTWDSVIAKRAANGRTVRS
jgi:hypothetical protein